MTTVDHAVGRDNSLASVTREISGGGNPPASPTTNNYLVNLAGNTVLDGAYFYQYDAWNRLVEVRLAGTLTASDFDSHGRWMQCPPVDGQPPPNYGVPGAWVVRYVYDGLGRLVEKSTPVFGGQNETRREEYHYDGVRRIQELVRREIAVTVVPGGEGGEPNPEGKPGDPVPSGGLGLEEPAEVMPGEPLVPVEVVTALPAGWDQREYVWGPEYVDELAWQVDKDGTPYYALLDANYNVMAVLAGADVPLSSGDPAGTPTIPAGAVVEQYVWSPYGELLSRDVLDRRVNADGTPTPTTGKLVTDAGAARPPNGNDPGSPGTAGASLPGIRNKVGHQGLFFERFDGLNTDPPLVPTDTTATTPTAPAGRGKGLYFARNRWYDATLGRFFTADPNASGSSILSALAYHGAGIVPAIDEFSGQIRYRDGLSLFAFGRSNPLRGGDPVGLVYDPFEEADEIIGAMWGERAAAAEQAYAFFEVSAQIAGNMALEAMVSMIPGGFLALSIYHFNNARLDMAENGLTWENGFEAVSSMAGITGSAVRMMRAANGARMTMKAARAGRLAGCNSLCAGTEIETPTGMVPIEWLQVGDWIVARHQDDPASVPVYRRVTGLFRGEALCTEWIGLSTARAIRITPNHEVFSSERGWVRADELRIGEHLLDDEGNPVQVITVSDDPTPVPVYNITVDGAFTYYAEGVWVHNCISGRWADLDWNGFPQGVRTPSGKFRILEGEEYLAARRAADQANKRLRSEWGLRPGEEIHEIHPVKWGGDPESIANKVVLPSPLHHRVNSWFSSRMAAIRNPR